MDNDTINLIRYISALQEVIYWAARDFTHPSDYNRKCLENAFMVKDIAWDNLPFNVRNSIKCASKHYMEEAG